MRTSIKSASFTSITSVLLFVLVAVSLAASCTNNSNNDLSSSIFFPVQKAGLDSGMDAQLPGKLELDNGYIRIKYFDDNNLLIWPHGCSLLTENGEIWIIDDAGQAVAKVGDIVIVGGGEVTAGTVEGVIEQQLPEDCKGPFWLVCPHSIVDYDEAIRLNPQNIEAYYSRGVIYFDLGQLELAIEDFDEVIRLDREYVMVYYERGLAYKLQGKNAEAISDFEKFITLTDNTHLAEMARHHIEELSK